MDLRHGRECSQPREACSSLVMRRVTSSRLMRRRARLCGTSRRAEKSMLRLWPSRSTGSSMSQLQQAAQSMPLAYRNKKKEQFVSPANEESDWEGLRLRLLLDTHIWLWSLHDPKHLGKRVQHELR